MIVIKPIVVIMKCLLWLFCFITAILVLFFLYSLNYFLEKFFDDLVLNGIQVLIIAFILKLLFLRIYKKFLKKKLESLKKDSQEVFVKKSKRIGMSILKTKKCHVINLVVDTFLVVLLAIVSVAEVKDLTFVSELMVNLGIEKGYTIASLSGVLVLTLILQYKTTLSNPKVECKREEEETALEEKNTEKIYAELVSLFKGKED
ncbi:MAG: hypothetical protein FWE36_04755 [Erysipelotrichales bacterium]|nr:hypothetical protein [Erysipelotrichales bacterium]